MKTVKNIGFSTVKESKPGLMEQNLMVIGMRAKWMGKEDSYMLIRTFM